MGYPTQDALATKLDTDQSQVNRWENGKNSPDKAFRDKLKKVLKVDDAWFDPVSTSASFEFNVSSGRALLDAFEKAEYDTRLEILELLNLVPESPLPLQEEVVLPSRSAKRTSNK
jgi:transcriptional regulator with XRE-family HTH domain